MTENELRDVGASHTKRHDVTKHGDQFLCQHMYETATKLTHTRHTYMYTTM